jgi:hypothetical protein
MTDARQALPEWPRLMAADLAALYLSIGLTMLRERGPAPKRFGRRVLYDRQDLDRFADRLGGSGEAPPSAPLTVADRKEVERRYLDRLAEKDFGRLGKGSKTR